MLASRTNSAQVFHRFGPPMLITLGSLWLLQSAFAHAGSHGVILRNLHYDAGVVTPGSTVTDHVRIINLSSVPLEVEAQPGCGCTVADVPGQSLAPLHSEVVKFTVDTDGIGQGNQERDVVLQMRAGSQSWQQLVTIRFHRR